MDLQPIKQYAETYPGGLRKLAVDVGMSESNLHRCIRKNKIQASDLEALSLRLGVGIGIFFAEPPNAVETHENGLDVNVSWLQEKITLLEQRIKDKDELIKILKGI